MAEKTKICWHCGAGLTPDVLEIPFENATQRRMFGILYSKIGETVTFSEFGKTKLTVQNYMSCIRKILRDCGAPYVVEVEYGVGYWLRKIEL